MCKALIWDVYGTLLLTPGGGIPPEADKNTSLQRGFAVLGGLIGFSPREENIASYFQLISEQHAEQRREKGIRYPEIDIIRLWKDFFMRDYALDVPLPLIKKGALLFEETVNPVIPVAGMGTLLRDLHRNGVLMGLGSNSQFYTLHFLEREYPGIFPELFHPRLQALSYEIGAGKPDPLFYEVLTGCLRHEGLAPEECLFVGNDPVNDVELPRSYGLKALLFTPGGDGQGARTTQQLARSLRGI